MKRLLPFIILIFLVLGAVVAVPLLLRPERYRNQIQQHLATVFHRPVLIDKVQAQWWPPALSLQGVTAMDSSNSSPVLRVRQIQIKPVTAALFKLKFIPRFITVDNFWSEARRQADGSWDWIGVRLAGESGMATPLVFERIDLNGGEFHWVDPFAPAGWSPVAQQLEGTATLDQLTLRGQVLLGGLPIGIHWDGGFRSNASTGVLTLTDESRQLVLNVTKSDKGIDAKGESVEWRAEPILRLVRFFCRWAPSASTTDGVDTRAPIKELKVHWTVEGGGFSFYQTGVISGGRSELKGELSPAGDHQELQVTGAFQDVPFADLAAIVGTSLPMDGKLTGIGRFEIAVASNPWSHLQGQVTVEVKDGYAALPETAVRNLQKARTLHYLREKIPEFEKAGVPFKVWKWHGEASHGILKIDDALFDAGDLKAAWVGQLDLPKGGLDGMLRMQIREKKKSLLAKIPGHYLYGAPGHETVQPIYGRLQGAWDQWMVKAVPSGKVPRTVQERLRRALR